ncbi:MAG TPA: HAD-IA family hydrolase [Ktedonobacterales bacterium]|nr:HAD-IA family hydrolase [Ktedonobacterales bacterium]
MKHRYNRNSRWLPHPQSIQAIFFDVGFTLLESSPSIPVIVRDVMARRGTPVSLDCLERSLPEAEAHFSSMSREAPHTWGDELEIASIWRRYFSELLRPCYGVHGDEALAEAAADVQREFDLATSYALYPDVEEALTALKERGIKLGVISDWGIALGLIMRHFDLTRFFDFAVISATARRAKPDPELFRLALDRADVVPDYAMHVGDSYIRDVLGARALGITPILIDRMRMLQPEVLDCPLVYDLYELLDLLGIERPPEATKDRPA